MYDVIVIGAGPAGSITAKKCAELGLKTLLLERKSLPRDKLCSGMVIGQMAREIIQEEFGPIPDEVLTTPHHLLGYMLHAPGVESKPVAQEMSYAWRRDLDFWMTQQARQAGAEVRDKAKVTSVEPRGDQCLVKLDGEAVEAKFVIGADGTKSAVRKLLNPGLELAYRIAYRECYRGELALDRNYFHLFFPLSRPRPRFDLNYKGAFFLLEGSIKELSHEITQSLSPYGFSRAQKPLWKDGCLSRAQSKAGLFAGSFIPAKGNILLVGDAAMLQLPVTGEGIGMALNSGLLAARSIAEALASKRQVAEVYLPQFEPLLNTLKELSPYDRKVEEAGKKGPAALLNAFAEGFRATLKIT